MSTFVNQARHDLNRLKGDLLKDKQFQPKELMTTEQGLEMIRILEMLCRGIEDAENVAMTARNRLSRFGLR